MHPKGQASDLSSRIGKTKAQLLKSLKLLEVKDLPATPFSIKQAFFEAKKEKHKTERSRDKKEKEGLKTVNYLVKKWLENDIFRYAPSTQRIIRSSIKQFTDYLSKSGQSGLEIKELSAQVISNYERYLQDKKRLGNGTHGRCMKHLRWFLKTTGYPVQTIKIRRRQAQIIALTESELTRLEKVDVKPSIGTSQSKGHVPFGLLHRAQDQRPSEDKFN